MIVQYKMMSYEMTWLLKEYVLCKVMQVPRNVCLSECKCQYVPVSASWQLLC